VSLTLADLYRRQGRVEEAASVLRALMESRPGDPELTRRLDELGALGEPVRRSARIAVLTALLARVRRRARVARG
jgi:lipopolysaccharide biosynthesis regulator YciM